MGPRHATSVSTIPVETLSPPHNSFQQSALNSQIEARKLMAESSLIPPFERCCKIALQGFSLQILSFIIEMFPSGQRQRHFGQAALGKVHPQRNKCESALLSFPEESPDLLFVEKKLPAAFGIISLYATVTIWADMDIIEEHFVIFHPCVAFLETDLTFTK